MAREYYQKNYNWKPIVYDSQNAWNYLFGRATKEYAALLRVFSEIAKRDPDFKPRSFFDFGAGIGTGTWAAANLWRKSLYEYFVVDESRDMNDLSELLLRDGNMDKKMALKNVFYRQFLPAQDEVHIANAPLWCLFLSNSFLCAAFLFLSVQITFGPERVFIQRICEHEQANRGFDEFVEQV